MNTLDLVELDNFSLILNNIKKTTELMLQYPQVEPITKHVFWGGMYCREVFTPAGTLIAGKKHLVDHLYLLLEGEILVASEDFVKRLIAPCLVCSKAGSNKLVYSVTDSLRMTIHRTDKHKVEDLEGDIVEKTDDSPFDIFNRLKRIEV